MAYEGGIDSAVAVELLFEGEDHERFVDVVAEQADASLAPRPELRGYVVDGGDAALFHLAGYAPVEGRRIDDDGEVGLAVVGFGNEMFVQAVDFREVAEDFGDADYGQVFCVDDGVAPGGAHAVSADAEEFEGRVAAAQGFDELGAIHFTGGFSGGDQDSHGCHCTGRRRAFLWSGHSCPLVGSIDEASGQECPLHRTRATFSRGARRALSSRRCCWDLALRLSRVAGGLARSGWLFRRPCRGGSGRCCRRVRRVFRLDATLPGIVRWRIGRRPSDSRPSRECRRRWRSRACRGARLVPWPELRPRCRRFRESRRRDCSRPAVGRVEWRALAGTWPWPDPSSASPHRVRQPRYRSELRADCL